MAEAARDSARPAARGTGGGGSAGALAGDHTAVWQLPQRARLALRINPGLLPGGGDVAGFPLGMPINRWQACERGRALRLGPDEWLLWASDDAAAGIAADMASALAGLHHSLVDVSHGRTAFAVAGAAAERVLNSGCPLDLSPGAFPLGAATRTLLGKCEIILVRTAGQPTFEIECGRSFAQYVREFLRAALPGQAPADLDGREPRIA